jgi:hypothetical protein
VSGITGVEPPGETAGNKMDVAVLSTFLSMNPCVWLKALLKFDLLNMASPKILANLLVLSLLGRCHILLWSVSSFVLHGLLENVCWLPERGYFDPW